MRNSEGKFPHQQRPPYLHRLIDENGKTGKKKIKLGKFQSSKFLGYPRKTYPPQIKKTGRLMRKEIWPERISMTESRKFWKPRSPRLPSTQNFLERRSLNSRGNIREYLNIEHQEPRNIVWNILIHESINCRNFWKGLNLAPIYKGFEETKRF